MFLFYFTYCTHPQLLFTVSYHHTIWLQYVEYMAFSVQRHTHSVHLQIFSYESSLVTSLRNQPKTLKFYLGCSPCHSSPPDIHKGMFPSHQCTLHHGYMDWTNKKPSSRGSQLQFHCQQHNCRKETLLWQQDRSLGKILHVKQTKLL